MRLGFSIFLLFCSINQLKAVFVPKFINYCEEQGLCNQEVYDVMSDQSGLIWIATDDGLFNFDGKTFNHFNKSDGLTDNTIYKIIEDDQGNLWMMTGTKKLCYYANKKIHPYPYNAIIEETLPSGSHLMGLNYNSQTGLKISVNFGGLLSIDNKGNSSYFGSSSRQIDTSKCGSYLLKEDSQTLPFEFYGNRACLGKQDSAQFHICYIDSTNQLQVRRTFSLESFYGISKSLAVKRACALSDGGLVQIWHDGIYIVHDDKIKHVFIEEAIISIREIDRKLWIGTRNGVFTYHLDTEKLVYQNYLREYGISSVAKDIEGGFWFSTLEKGLFYTPNLQSTHQKLPNDQSITADFIRDGHELYISYRDGRIDVFDLNDQTIRPFIMPQKKLINTFGMAIDSKKRVFVGGLDLICYESGKMVTEKIASPSDFTKRMIRHKDDIFVLSKTNLFRINSDLAITKYPIDLQNITGLSTVGDTIYVLCEFRSFTFEIHPDTLIAHEAPKIKYCVDVWKREQLLAGITKDGRLMYENTPKNTRFYSVPILNDLIVNDVLVENNIVWLASNKGILRLDHDSKTPLTLLDGGEGLASVNVLQLERFEDELYYLTKNNLGKIKLPIQTDLNQPVIHGLRFKSTDYTYENTPAEIVLSELDNEFHIYPHCFSYKNPEKIVFNYRLKGANKTTNTTTSPEISYSGLPSGQYDFYVTATTNNINFSAPAEFRLIIESPFWKKWWFLALALSFIAGITAFIVRQRIKGIRKKAALQLEMVELRSKALGAQMNPHFMFNFLNSLQLKIMRNETVDAIDYLDEFCGLIRKNLNYSNESYITLLQEIELSKSYLNLEKIRHKENLVFHFQIDPELDLSQYKVPPLLIQPFIENAIVHGFSQKKEAGKITIILSKSTDHAVVIRIIDNGEGFGQTKNKRHKSLGINLIRQRIALHHAKNTLTINSQPNEGTEVVLILYEKTTHPD